MGKTIVITGGGAGLGRAMARRLARDGHRLALLGRTAAKVEAVAAEIGHGAFGIGCDVAEAASIAEAFAEVARRAPRVDMLVNNAAVYEPHAIAEATDAQIAGMLDTNLAGLIRCTRDALPLMGRGGHIVNISTRTVAAPAVMLALYQTSKAGVERFTRTLREEVEEQGIRVTLIRAAGMMDEDTQWSLAPDLARRFAEARARRGIGQGEGGVSHFDSVAALMPWLIDLPPDVGVTELMLEARAP